VPELPENGSPPSVLPGQPVQIGKPPVVKQPGGGRNPSQP